MKVYTEKDLEGFERDDLGRLICPSGDYTQIKGFGEGCSFGECCSFGERCSFGEGCRFGEGCSFERGRVSDGRYMAVDRIGSEKRKTYFFADKDGNILSAQGAGSAIFPLSKNGCGMCMGEPGMKKSILPHAILRS